MGADEFHFHRRRGLSRWERWGHPLDTLGLASAIALTLLVPPEPFYRWGYGFLALLSCLLITKDEWVHARECGPSEHWLHACLFILHPMVLFAVYSLWLGGSGKALSIGFLISALLFTAYQWVYWNSSWPKQRLP